MLCFDSKKVGYLKKTHGIKGEVIVEFDFPLPKSFKLTKWVFLKYEGTLIPFMVEWYQILDDHSIILKFINFNNVDSVKIFVFSEFHIESNVKWLTKIEISYLNIVDYKIFDPSQNYLGTIIEILPIKNNPVAEIRNGNQTILIPFHDKFIKSIDHNHKSIILKLPNKADGNLN